jgi:hypothetical protein
MNCGDSNFTTIVGGLVGALIFPLVIALCLWMVRRRPSTMRTADSGQIERETRRVRAGARVDGPIERRLARDSVVNAAQASALDDFRTVGRQRANPYPRHSRNAAYWALEYSSTWESLHQATIGGSETGNPLPQARP